MQISAYPYAANFAGGDAQSEVDGHDLRGTPEFVERVKGEPALLIPPVLLEQCKDRCKAVDNTSLAGL